MNADEVRLVRLRLGLSAEAFARLLQVQGGRTVRKWEAADRGVSGPVAVIATALMENGAVRDYFGVRLLVEKATGREVPGMQMKEKHMFGSSYATVKLREAASGAAKLVATWDPAGATEADIEDAKKNVDTLAAMAAESMSKSQADQNIVDTLQAEYSKYKTAALSINDQVQSGDASKSAVLEKLLGKAEELSPRLEEAKAAAADSKAWFEEAKGYHESAVQNWTGKRAELDKARRELDRAKQQEAQQKRVAAQRAQAAGLAGNGSGSVALDAMKSAAADAQKRAEAARLTSNALGHATDVDADVAAALAAVDKKPASSLSDRLSRL